MARAAARCGRVCVIRLARGLMLPVLVRVMFFLALSACAAASARPERAEPPPMPSIAAKVAGMRALPGFFPLYWDDKEGKLWLEIDRWQSEFLYQSGLAAGVGSNDI